MATNYINPNTCNKKPSCVLIFNDGGGYSVPDLTTGLLTLNDGSSSVVINYADIIAQSVDEICSTAGVKGQWTLTVNTAPSTACCNNTLDYNVAMEWQESCSQVGSKNYHIIGSGNVPDTTTTIATAIKNAINADPSAVVTASSSGAVVTVTAKTEGLAGLLIKVTSNITLVASVANTAPAGNYDDLVAMGIDGALLDGTSATYAQIWISYWEHGAASTLESANSSDACGLSCRRTCLLLVEEDGTAAFQVLTNSGALLNILEGAASTAQYNAKHSTTWCTNPS